MKFTEREFELLSDGIEALMHNAAEMAKLLPYSARSAVFGMQGYRDELQALHGRLCDEVLSKAEQPELKTEIAVVVHEGRVTGVYANSDHHGLTVDVIDKDNIEAWEMDDPERADAEQAALNLLAGKIERGEMVAVW